MAFLDRILFLSLLSLAQSEFPFDPDVSYLDEDTPQTRNDQRFRLPEDFDPIHCEIEITPYFTDAPAGKTNFTFDGKATLMIKALKANLTTVTVHDNLRTIEDVIINDENGTKLETSYRRDTELQFLIVTSLNKTFEKDKVYKMNVTYVGNINETPLSRGMFRGHYKDENGTIRWYAATHLQPTHSRQLLPSFDEPGFKSRFDIIVHRPASFSPTFSNMRNKTSGRSPVTGRVKETFETTPRMSAYLISIHISDGFKVIADNNNQNKSYRVIARPTATGQGEYALEVGPRLTAWFDKYLGIEYYKMFEGIKNDQLASPYWASGATENWGLVTYRELRLLNEVNETNSLDKMSIATIIAHELAHKWFGNYITCRWWDNVWINEGFASYFQYFAMDGVDKNMELEDQFNIMSLQSALSADSSINTRALRHNVNTPAQVSGHFSGISYTKGASLLLMLKHLVTENTFKKALNRFLTTRAFQHAFPEDIYEAFKNATTEDSTLPTGVDITSFMSVWVDEPGYPVLNVNVNRENGTITLSQERYYNRPVGPPSNQTWPLPLTFTSGAQKNFNNLKATHVMTTKDMKIQNQSRDDYFIFNLKQKAIYRVNYDIDNWNHIREDLLKNHKAIHHLNRAQIVDDIFAFMQSKRLDYKNGFNVLRFLKNDTSYYSWYPAITGFNRIRNSFVHNPSALQEYDKILYSYMEAVINDVGYDSRTKNETLTKTLNRLFILAFACNIGHPGCVEDAAKRFRALVDGNVKVDPDLRRHVYCTGLRQGNYSDWRHIQQLWQQSNNQAAEVTMLRALGCTSDTTAINEYIEMVISDQVKAQDRLNAITWLYVGHKDNAKQMLAFLKKENNLEKLRKAFALQSWFQSAITSIASYLDKDGLNDMKSWIDENKDSIPEHQVVLSAINSAETAMAQGDETQQILEALRDSAATLVPTMMLLITTFVALLLK